MNTFILLTRLTSKSLASPGALETIEEKVTESIRSECPEVEWVHNFAVLGPYDYLDIFRAPDSETAFKVSTIVRTFGYAHTEVWNAREWSQFKELIRNLPVEEHQ
ncbi:GYD domain-containing protein [Desulfonatronospira sp.]|uniref:GYD domain-containing protein n=1 Tax=Desulfonatronospira sp. TaxID=1962951 RepID=UPI0025C5249B|nr:GYD domain-containing protein [Desulfonatronospira sp.]